MKENFQTALKYVLKNEGGNDDDPVDRGGRTSRGITQRTYDAWRKLKGLPTRDVWTATDAEVASIYRENYWGPIGDALPKGIDYLYFDMAVNAGPHQAAVLLQRALGVAEDGKIGPITKLAIKEADPKQLIADYTRVKAEFYRGLAKKRPSQKKFLKGWINRALEVEKNALKMVNA